MLPRFLYLATQAPHGGGATITGQGKVDVRNCRLYGNAAKIGGGLHVEPPSSCEENCTGPHVNLHSTSIYRNRGSGLHVGGGTVNVNDGDIYENDNERHGGGVTIDGGRVVFNKVDVHQNRGGDAGGGVAITDGDVTFNSMKVRNNTAINLGVQKADAKNSHMTGDHVPTKGGGVFVANGKVRFASTLVQGNIAEIGGGVSVDDGNVTFETVSISSNAGGGVSFGGSGLNTRATFTLTHIRDNTGVGVSGTTQAVEFTSSTISGNTEGGASFESGTVMVRWTKIFDNRGSGGVRVAGGAAFFVGASIYANTAGKGGGLAVYGGSLSFRSGEIYENSCTEQDGGGVYVQGGTVLFKWSNIHRNAAYIRHDPYKNPSCGSCVSSKGGGVHVAVGGTAAFVETQIHDNEAHWGAGLYTEAETARGTSVTDTQIHGNRNATAGGGIFLAGTLVMRNSSVDSNAASTGVNVHAMAGTELLFVFPTPLGRYLEGTVKCKEQMCQACDDEDGCYVPGTESEDDKENVNKSAYVVRPCELQFCNASLHGGEYLTRLDTSGELQQNESFPPLCPAGSKGDSVEPSRQSSAFCAGICPAGHFCTAGTVEPSPCPAGTFSAGGAESKADCLPCA